MSITSQHFLEAEKRDLTNAVILSTPTRTPFATLLMGKGVTKAKDRVVTWRERSLNTTPNAPSVEGADAPAHKKGTRTLFTNYTQIIERTAAVTKSAEFIEVQGYDSTLAQEEYDKMLEAKLDLNHYLLNGVKTDEDVDNNIGQQMNGLLGQITITKPAVGALTFEKLLDPMVDLYQAGTEGDKFAIMNANVASWVDKLSKGDSKDYVITVEAGETGVTAEIVITRIATRHGFLHIMIDDDMPAGQIAYFDVDSLELTALYPFEIEALAKTGSTRKSLIGGEYSIKLLNSKSAVLLKGVTAPTAATLAVARGVSNSDDTINKTAIAVAEAVAKAVAPAVIEEAAEPKKK